MSSFNDRIVFVDVETVCLEAAPGSVWEIAVLTSDNNIPDVTQIRPNLLLAHPKALDVGGFADRYRADLALNPELDDVESWLADRLPPIAVVVGSNPQFDIAHLDHLYPHPPKPWHYHPCDLPSLVAGATGRWPEPAGSLSLRWAAETVGVDPDGYETHTAGGDVALARAVWDAVQPPGSRCDGGRDHDGYCPDCGAY